MARIQITDLNSSNSELSYELSEQESQSVVGGATYDIYDAEPPFPGGLGGRIKVHIKPLLK